MQSLRSRVLTHLATGSTRVRRRTTVVFLACIATGCQGVLDVDLVGNVPADRLNDPALAISLVNGVLGDVECAFDTYAASAALLSDEFDNVLANVVNQNLGTRNIGPGDDVLRRTCDVGDFATYVPLQIARVQAEGAIRRLEGWTDEQVGDRARLMARVRAYGAYAYLLLGEGFDSVAFGDGRRWARDSALARAESWFTAALSLPAEEAMHNLARVGRARVRLDRGNLAGAATDAAAVPPGFRLMITRGASPTRRQNKLFALRTTMTVRPEYRGMTVNGVPDPRVVVTGPEEVLGIEVYFASKHNAFDAAHRLASYEEAQLILAEAVGGVTAVNVINALRDARGLPRYAGGSAAAVLAQVLEERRREFFAEGAIRLNDLARHGLSWKSGTAPIMGTRYGTMMRLPLPTIEVSGVP